MTLVPRTGPKVGVMMLWIAPRGSTAGNAD